ncbi:MAG: DUF4238 domain-containing protein [Firmicutes bacterium]|nr:DUF4238 domain-containing protein [Bacillota bacterium]
MINSHIRMPKCVLKQFADDNHVVYFWDLEKGWILDRSAKSINTEKDYYSEDAEHFLRDNIETPLGQILKFVRSIDPKNPEFTMDNEMKDVMRRFVHSLVARSRAMLTKINQTSIFAQFLPKRDLHDWAAVMGIEEAHNSRVFEDWEITFTENHTEVPFILPLCGTYSFSFNGDTMFNVPVTPHYAITFMPRAVAHKYVIDGKMRLFQIVNSEQAMRFNMFALNSERKDGNYGIASNSRKLLEVIKESVFQQTE